MVDYIIILYVILPLLLIGSIIFIIYLSYEKGENKNYKDIHENFSQMMLSNFNEAILTGDFNSIKTSFYRNYDNLITDINNQRTNRDKINKYELQQIVGKNAIDLAKIKNYTQLLEENKEETYPINKSIKTIKSNYNSQLLSIFPNDTSKYGILANDKCITVNGLCKDEFCLLECQKDANSSNSQKFTTKRIYNNIDAANIMNVKPETISSTNVYPYNIFISAINNNCLTMTNEGVNINQCNLNDIKQQWKISPNENICILK
jgi:hypothetical protein